MDRIDKLCAYLPPCGSFADVGCDHGYCTKYMLLNGLCKTAVISDISGKCLQKAERLLRGYIDSGAVKAVCCNGLEKIDKNTDLVLIAGMGGEEIVNILKTAYIPHSFVFQPMKNVRAVREFLLSKGAEITVDEPFESGGKFYYVLKGVRQGKCSYSKAELEFGKSLKSAETKAYMRAELEKKRAYLQRELNENTRAEIAAQAKFIEGVLIGEIE